MGENEQGGMLRNVVVIGLVAMIALVVTLAVVGLKGNMKSGTSNATNSIQKQLSGDSNDDTNVVTDDFNNSSYYYSDPDSNNMVTITGMTTAAREAASGTVVIPSYLKRNGKIYTVNKLDSYLYSSTKITGVVIPNTIESIGSNAFQYTSLTSVTVPDSVKTIGAAAFSDIPANKDGFVSIGKNTSYNNDTWHASFGYHWVGSNEVPYTPTIRS